MENTTQVNFIFIFTIVLDYLFYILQYTVYILMVTNPEIFL